MLGPPGGIPAGIQTIEFAEVWLARLSLEGEPGQRLFERKVI